MAMNAPRPYCMIAEAIEPFGYREAMDARDWDSRIAPIWDLYGAGKAKTHCRFANIGKHNYDQAKQVIALKFFNVHFKGNDGAPTGCATPIDKEPEDIGDISGRALVHEGAFGWLADPYENNAAWLQYRLGRMWLSGISPPMTRNALDTLLTRTRAGIAADAFRGLPSKAVTFDPTANAIRIDSSCTLDFTVSNVPRENGIRVPVFILVSPEGSQGLQGMKKALETKGYAVVSATFRGTGDNRINHASKAGQFIAPDFVSNQWVRAFGAPTLGLMYYDIKRLVDYLHLVPYWCDTAKIGVVGEDIGGMAALITAMMDDRVSMAGTKQQLYSWMHKPTGHRNFRHMAYGRPRTEQWHQATWAYGVGKYADLTMMPGLSFPCAVYIGGGDAWFNIYSKAGGSNERTPLRQKDLETAFGWSRQVYNQLDKNGNLKIKAGAQDQDMADWFEKRIRAGDILDRSGTR